MIAQTKMSVKGQIVIPKDVRERLNWQSGTDLELTETGSGVFLQPVSPKRRKISFAEFKQLVPPHEGPQGNEASWRVAIDEDFRSRAAEWTGKQADAHGG